MFNQPEQKKEYTAREIVDIQRAAFMLACPTGGSATFAVNKRDAELRFPYPMVKVPNIVTTDREEYVLIDGHFYFRPLNSPTNASWRVSLIPAYVAQQLLETPTIEKEGVSSELLSKFAAIL